MEENKIEISELTEAWDTLRYDMKKTGKISFESFYDTFSKTYLLLSQHSSETSIDKKYIALIVSAFSFAGTEGKELDFKHRAALVLTERMLNAYAVNTSLAPDGNASVYLLEMRKEVHVNFGEVTESVNKLAAIFEDGFWRKM